MPDQPMVEPLTRREREILLLLADGLSAPEIAQKLSLAVSSVKWYIQQVYGKLGVNSKQKALVRAGELGLLGAPQVSAGPTPPIADAPAVHAPRHNLPVQVTRFFGRENEIAQLSERLAEHRLVTLTGSGGVGKTRLSLRVAEELVGDYPDGVWLVELAPLTDPALVPQQFAAVLGLRDNPGQPMLATLTSNLRDRQALLVLDNCEHLLEACAQVADALLHSAPGIKILASSREPLGVPGEAVFPIPQLAFPPPGQAVSAESLGDYASVRLLLDRARLVLPGYQPTADDSASLAYIVQRLDGIPLAIEMAAARLNILSAEQLAGRLDDVFRVLTGGSRTALPRQQTLRATMDWSYKLLSEPERLLLRRLSVFAGGCTLEAAEAVCARDGLEVGEVLELLGALVAKSMVIAVRPAGQSMRYYLFETVRQYAREKLQDAGEGAPLRTRQRDYFLAITDAAGMAHGTTAWPGLSAKVAGDVDNVRLALEWSFSDSVNLEAVPRLVIGAVDFWPSYSEGIEWTRRGIAWCESHPEISARLFARFLTWTAVPFAKDIPRIAIDQLKRAAEICRSLIPGEPQLLMVGLWFMSAVYLNDLNDMDSALSALSEAEALIPEFDADAAQSNDHRLTVGFFETLKSDIAVKQDRYQDAKRHATEALRLFEGAGDRVGVRLGLIKLAIARLKLGEFSQARDDLLQAQNLLGGGDGYLSYGDVAYILRWLGEADLQQGNLDQALEYGRDSLGVANKIPDHNIVASGLGLAAMIFAKQGKSERAAQLSGASAAMYARQHRNPWEDSSLDALLPGWREGPDYSALNEAFIAGQAMSAEQAVAYALADA